MKKINGTEIIKLVGVSETDVRVLDLISLLGIDRCKVERDEIGDYRIELEDEMGLDLRFSSVIPTEMEQRKENTGGLYLVDADFNDECDFLPFGITIEDNLEIVEGKIGKKANYVEVIDENLDTDEDDIPSYTLYWMYEDLGWLTIQFDESDYSNIFNINCQPYEDPDHKDFKDIMKYYLA